MNQWQVEKVTSSLFTSGVRQTNRRGHTASLVPPAAAVLELAQQLGGPVGLRRSTGGCSGTVTTYSSRPLTGPLLSDAQLRQSTSAIVTLASATAADRNSSESIHYAYMDPVKD